MSEPPQEWRTQAFAQLARGLVQVWPALTAGERDEARQLLPDLRSAFAWPGGTSDAPPAWTGPVEIAPEEEYRIIDRAGGYYVRRKEYLEDLSRFVAEVNAADETLKRNQPEPAPSVPPVGEKRSTERGEGHRKLVAALTKHHRYADGGALNVAPIGNNKLARGAGVSESTASAFFGSAFGGHTKYQAMCRNVTKLAAALKLLNGEFAPHHLFGREPPGEDDRGDEE